MGSKALQRIGPKLKSGGDAEAAVYLKNLCEEARNGLRRVVALGMFCFKIKGDLPHGQFQAWLTEHCADISLRSLKSYMQLTDAVLKKCGVSNGQSLPICHGGEILLLEEAKVPKESRPLREKIFHLIDGKSAHQLMLEFAQADEDDEGNLNKKRGRTKGCKGTTKEQRQKAREREEQERIEGIELDTQDHDKWMEKNGGPKGVGMISDSRFKKHLQTVEWYFGVLKTLSRQRGDQ
jgi:hypothetical protein